MDSSVLIFTPIALFPDGTRWATESSNRPGAEDSGSPQRRPTLLDKLRGSYLSLSGKAIAITGASGTLGQALSAELERQGARVLSLTTSPTFQPSSGGVAIPWQPGKEADLRDLLAQMDILVINHGVNVYGDRTPDAIQTSLEVNALSSGRLIEVFLETLPSQGDRTHKEIWVNTSEAEVSPAFSPLYEVSKRLLGDLITLRRLDAPCVIRKVILGPFKSNLNPIGIMSAPWVAWAVVALAKRDVHDIIVSVNPLTYVVFPLKEWGRSLYFRLFSHPPRLTPP